MSTYFDEILPESTRVSRLIPFLHKILDEFLTPLSTPPDEEDLEKIITEAAFSHETEDVEALKEKFYERYIKTDSIVQIDVTKIFFLVWKWEHSLNKHFEKCVHMSTGFFPDKLLQFNHSSQMYKSNQKTKIFLA